MKKSPVTDSPAKGEDTSREPILDLNALLRRAMGDWEIVQVVIGKFQKRVPNDLALLEKHTGEGKLESVYQIAHALKGASANLSAEPIRQAAAELEAAGRAEQLEACRAALARLAAEWHRFAGELPGALQEHTQA
jgi:HPt (histidine-containing phosphotransfer) domain-containing protein